MAELPDDDQPSQPTISVVNTTIRMYIRSYDSNSHVIMIHITNYYL